MRIISNWNAGKSYTAFLLVKSAEEKQTKTGKPYVIISATDGETDIMVKMWNASAADLALESGKLYKFDVTVGSYNGDKDYTISAKPEEATFLDDVKLSDYIRTAPEDPASLWEDIMCTLATIKDEQYYRLAVKLLTDHKDEYMRHGAAKSVHHNFLGGLIYHSARMMRVADMLSMIYPSLNRDLLIVGTVIHDIGKLYELDTNEVGVSDYTIEGNLFGHLLIGSDMVRDCAREIGMDNDHLIAIRHLIVSHHGKLEWGAIQIPSTLEANFLHLIDDMDAKAMQFEAIFETLEPGKQAPARVNALGSIYPYRNAV